MRANAVIQKVLFLLIYTNSVYCQENKTSSEIGDKIDTLDKDCLSEIARAKSDIKENKIVFTRILHLKDFYPRKFEMDSLLKLYSISVVEGYGSCFYTPGKRKHCYKGEMDKEINKRYGPKFIDSIYDIAERIYVLKHINDTFKYEECDYSPRYPNEKDYNTSLKKAQIDFFNEFKYPADFKYKNEEYFSYSSAYFYLLKDGSISELEVETTFQNKENDKHKNEFEEKIKTFISKTKWIPATAKGIKVNSIMELTFFYK